jgi:hypothetical protein
MSEETRNQNDVPRWLHLSAGLAVIFIGFFVVWVLYVILFVLP